MFSFLQVDTAPHLGSTLGRQCAPLVRQAPFCRTCLHNRSQWSAHSVTAMINSSEPLRKLSDAHNKHLINICNYYDVKILALEGAFKMAEE